MDRIIGGALGLAAFAAVVALSLAKGISFSGCAVRGVVALVLGYLVGRLIFGLPGLSIVREAAGPVPQGGGLRVSSQTVREPQCRRHGGWSIPKPIS